MSVQGPIIHYWQCSSADQLKQVLNSGWNTISQELITGVLQMTVVGFWSFSYKLHDGSKFDAINFVQYILDHPAHWVRSTSAKSKG